MAESTVHVRFVGDTSSATRAVAGLDASFKGLLKTTAVLAGTAGLGAVFANLTKQTIDFDRSMRNVNSIAKLSERDFKNLEKQVLSLSKATAKGPKDLADGLYDIVSSGFKANDAIKILNVSAKAATAGMTNTATASKAVVAVLNAYGLSADKAKNVSSLLFAEVNKGVNTFEELATNIGDTAPQAAALKIPFSEVAAALATITLHGTSMAEASTQVSRVLTSMIKPSKDLAAEFKSMGYENGQAAIAALGFSGVLQRLSRDAGGNQQVLASWLGDIRGIRGVLNLTGDNLKTFTGFVGDMGSAFRKGGEDTKAFNEQAKSISFQWNQAKATLSAAAVALGIELLPALSKVITRFNEWLSGGGLERLQARLKEIVDRIRGVVDAMGGWETAFKIVLSGLLTIKVLQLVDALTRVGAAAGVAAGAQGTGGLLANLSRLAALGPITIPIAAVITMKVFEDDIVAFINRHPLLGFLDKRGDIDIMDLPAIAALDDWVKRGLAEKGLLQSGPNVVPKGRPDEGTRGAGAITVPAGGLVSPIPTGANRGIIGTPNVGTHSASDWQSANAVDVKVHKDTPVLAPFDGTITYHVGPSTPTRSGGKILFGDQATLVPHGGGVRVFLTHIKVIVPNGSTIKKGQVIGYAVDAGSGTHVHVATETGNPLNLVNAVSGKGFVDSSASSPSGTAGVSGTSGAAGTNGKTGSSPSAPGLSSEVTAAFKTVGAAIDAGSTLLREKIQQAVREAAQIQRVRDTFKAALKDGVVTDSDLERIGKGLEGIKGKIAAGMRNAAQSVLDARDRFRQSFDTFVGYALEAFDRSHAKLRDALKATLTFDDVQVKIGLGDLTPTEKLLADRAKAAREQDLQDAVDKARAKLDLARQSGEDLADAEKDYQDAVDAQQTYFLEQKAARERQAADDALALVQRNFDDQTAIQRVGFETQLRQIGERMATGRLTYKQGLDAVKALFAEYQVPFDQQGTALGNALQNAMLGAFRALQTEMGKLASAIENLVRLMRGKADEAKKIGEEVAKAAVGVGAGVGGAVEPTAGRGMQASGSAGAPATGSVPVDVGIPPDNQYSSAAAQARGREMGFALGTLHVPYTGLFQLHAGEQVVTAGRVSSRRPFEDGWGGGRMPVIEMTFESGMEWLAQFIRVKAVEASPDISREIGLISRNRLLTGRR